MTRDFLIWGGGFVNKGAEALLKTTDHYLQPKYPEAVWHVESLEAEKELVRGLGREPFLRPDSPWTEPWEKWTYRAFKGRSVRSRAKQVTDFIDISGLAYGGETCRFVDRTLFLTSDIKRRGGRVVFLPQAYLRFMNSNVQREAIELFSTVDLLFVRDSRSLEYLNELSGGIGNKAVLAPDIAFQFPKAPKEQGLKVLQQAGMAEGTHPFITIAPNIRIYERTGKGEQNNPYVQALIEITQWFLDNTDHNVVLIPHEIRFPSDPYPDDRYLIKLVSSHFSEDSGRVVPILQRADAESLKAVVGLAEFMVASRYHALVGALSQQIPSAVIGWSHKYEELCRDAGLSSEHCTGYSPEELKLAPQVCASAWEEKKSIEHILNTTVPVLKDRSSKVFQRTSDFLKG